MLWADGDRCSGGTAPTGRSHDHRTRVKPGRDGSRADTAVSRRCDHYWSGAGSDDDWSNAATPGGCHHGWSGTPRWGDDDAATGRDEPRPEGRRSGTWSGCYDHRSGTREGARGDDYGAGVVWMMDDGGGAVGEEQGEARSTGQAGGAEEFPREVGGL